MDELTLRALLSSDSLFRNPLLGGLLVSTLCATLGIYVALRRIVLLGVALPQVAAAGVALVFWATGHGHDSGEAAHGTARIGALAATFAALAYLLPRRREASTPTEWRVGAVLAVSMAATILLVALSPRGDLELTGMLRGDLLSLPDEDLGVLAAASALTFGVFWMFWRGLLLTSFDPDYARTLGVSTRLHDGLLYAMLGVAIGLGVMAAGPLVVFGFLVLPAFTALRVASGMAGAFAISIGIAASASLAGFLIAYRADLPAGPTGVALAAAAGAVLTGAVRGARALRRHRSVTGVAVAALLLGAAGCATHAVDSERSLPRGTFPAVSPDRPVAVLPIHDATGEHLRIPSSNPLSELARAAGDPFQARGETVPDRLQLMAAAALARRSVPVLPVDDVRRLVPGAPDGPAAAASAARRAGIEGPALQATLRRFQRTGSDLLLVQLDLALVEPSDGRVLWTGRARGPYPVRSALTLQEILADVNDRLFADAFGGG